MTFNRVNDFEFDLSYGKNSAAGVDGIAKVKITGLTEAMKKHKDDIKASEIPPKVRISIELSNSGLVSVPEATLQIGKLTFKGILAFIMSFEYILIFYYRKSQVFLWRKRLQGCPSRGKMQY